MMPPAWAASLAELLERRPDLAGVGMADAADVLGAIS